MQLQSVPGHPDGPEHPLPPPLGDPHPPTVPWPPAPPSFQPRTAPVRTGPPDAGSVAAEQLAARGVLLVSGPLDDEVASTIAARVLAMATSGERLTVRLTNVTGSVSAALMLLDVITSAGAPVTVIASGMLDTAGAVVLQAARATGDRAVSPLARIHLGQVREPATPGLDLERAAVEVELLRAQAETALGCSLDRPRMLNAEDAVAAGIADHVESRPR